jgi:hypothetical protein
MALRLDDLVVSGEILNTNNYSTHGWLRLRGYDQTLVLQLTGNCDADLQGRHFRFEARGALDTNGIDGDPAGLDISAIAWQQIGPTGTITAARKVKVSDCPPEEMYRRAKQGEPPPMQWKRCLYLEWFSQNGRVVVELVDPIIEFVDDPADDADAEVDAGVDTAINAAGDDDQHQDGAFGATLEINPIEFDENGDVEIDDEFPFSGDEDDFESESDEDPYGLFPEGLQQQFDLETTQLDRAIENDEDKPQSIREMELMDELIEAGDGDIIASIFDEPMKLPRPEQLDDEQVEAALKSLLGQMALYGIALAVCEHFTPRDAYRLLLDRICTAERAYPELRQTQWVQHFMTSEFCEQCEAEMDREFGEYERHRAENRDDLAIDEDDDVPF